MIRRPVSGQFRAMLRAGSLCCISLGQHCPFGRSTGAPRHYLDAPDLLEQRNNEWEKSYKTRQRRTFAISLNTSRKFRPRAKFRIVVTALNHSLGPWLTIPAFSKRMRVKRKRAIRPRVKKRRGA